MKRQDILLPPTTMVTIDLKYVFYTLRNMYNIKPNWKEIIEFMKSTGKIVDIRVFAELAKDRNLQLEIEPLRQYTSSIIDTSWYSGQPKYGTDAIIKQHITKSLMYDTHIEQYILFSGSGEFAEIAEEITFCHKILGVCGISGSFSIKLKETADWIKSFPIRVDELTRDCALRILRNVNRNKRPSYIKTIEVLSNDFDPNLVEDTLRGLLNCGILYKHPLPDNTKILKIDLDILHDLKMMYGITGEDIVTPINMINT